MYGNMYQGDSAALYDAYGQQYEAGPSQRYTESNSRSAGTQGGDSDSLVSELEGAFTRDQVMKLMKVLGRDGGGERRGAGGDDKRALQEVLGRYQLGTEERMQVALGLMAGKDLTDVLMEISPDR